MRGDFATARAINAALKLNWEEAVKLNSEIIKEDKFNTEAINRLAFAYLKLGKVSEAKTSYEKVLKLDPYNQIASKNLERIGAIKSKTFTESRELAMSPLTYLEEPGKTKIAECVNIAPLTTLSALSCGQNVILKPRNHTVEVRTDSGTYLGALPDDLSFRLIKLTAAGNIYQTLVKSVGKKKLLLFIREVKRGKKYANQPSFVGSGGYLGLDVTEVKRDKGDKTAGSDDESEEMPAAEE